MILLFGQNGQLGQALRDEFTKKGLDFRGFGRSEADFVQGAGFERLLDETKPSYVVNAAAYTKVDLAETERELCSKVNDDAVAALARATADRGVRLLHYSTDYVYGDRTSSAHVESDEAVPLNYYGMTKLAGENRIKAVNSRHLILRASWIYSQRGANFVKTILRLAQTKPNLSVVGDQLGAPISAARLAEITSNVVARGDSVEYGTYNVTSAGVTSWFDIAHRCVALGSELGLCPKGVVVQQIKSSEYPTAAKRPLNSRMDLTKFQTTFDYRLPHWLDDLDLTLKSWTDYADH